MRITQVARESYGQKVGLRPGDDLLRINGQVVRDIIDYQFLASDEYLEIEIRRNGNLLNFEIEKEPDESLGLVFEAMKFRCCGNNCIFCFIDQNPPGLRPSLYFKDEDYRLSFLHGNYVTLTHVSKRDLERIARQRLSPLYVSVHATGSETRKKLLGLNQDDHLLEKLDYLVGHGIEIHAQIVLCPDINDGLCLEKTIKDLAEYHPQLKSVALIPVGLTQFREGLYPIRPVTAEYASNIITWGESRAEEFFHQWNHYFLYLADEFYLLAQAEIPPAERYDDFFQIENGVGMTRAFLDTFAKQQLNFPVRLSQQKRIVLVTGTLAAGFMKDVVLARLNRVENLAAQLVVVPNHFFGTSVTVSGLLTGRDIFNQVKKAARAEVIFLPANCLNTDGKFLDNWTPMELENKLGCSVKILDDNFIQIFRGK